MIDVALKYLIADICIDACFDQIYKNFNVNAVDKQLPKIGEFFSRISHTLHHEVYYNCVVTNLNPIMGRDDEYIVYVRYERVDSDIDDDDDIDIYSLDEDDLREYVKDITGDDGLSNEEIDRMIDDGILDDDDQFDEDDESVPETVDLVETDNPMIVGVSTLFFTFHK